jgi:hypothetical protein
LLTECTIPVAILRNAPYSLPWGAHVYAKVLAKNIYGNSVESYEGNGAKITINPDPPINLLEDYA